MNQETADLKVARKALFGIPLALFPAVSLLIASPLIWGLWSGVLEGRIKLSGVHSKLLALLALVTGAVLAIPGYFVAAFEDERLVCMRSAGRWWVRSSLAAGLLASVAAAPLTFFFGRWLWVFPAGTALACLVLWLKSESLWRSQTRERGGGEK